MMMAGSRSIRSGPRMLFRERWRTKSTSGAGTRLERTRREVTLSWPRKSKRNAPPPPKPPPPSGDARGLEADSSSVPFSAPGGQGKEARRAQRRLMAVLRGDASEMRRHLQQLRSTSEALNDAGTVMD